MKDKKYRTLLKLPCEFFSNKSTKIICQDLHRIVEKELKHRDKILSQSKFSMNSFSSRVGSRKTTNESIKNRFFESASNDFPSFQQLEEDNYDIRSQEQLKTASFIRLPSKHFTMEAGKTND